MNPEPVVLINTFEVREGEDEAFLDGWERQRRSSEVRPSRSAFHASLYEVVREDGR